MPGLTFEMFQSACRRGTEIFLDEQGQLVTFSKRPFAACRQSSSKRWMKQQIKIANPQLTPSEVRTALQERNRATRQAFVESVTRHYGSVTLQNLNLTYLTESIQPLSSEEVFEVNEKCEKAVQDIKDRNLKLLSDFAQPQTTGREDSGWLDLPPPGRTLAWIVTSCAALLSLNLKLISSRFNDLWTRILSDNLPGLQHPGPEQALRRYRDTDELAEEAEKLISNFLSSFKETMDTLPEDLEGPARAELEELLLHRSMGLYSPKSWKYVMEELTNKYLAVLAERKSGTKEPPTEPTALQCGFPKGPPSEPLEERVWRFFLNEPMPEHIIKDNLIFALRLYMKLYETRQHTLERLPRNRTEQERQTFLDLTRPEWLGNAMRSRLDVFCYVDVIKTFLVQLDERRALSDNPDDPEMMLEVICGEYHDAPIVREKFFEGLNRSNFAYRAGVAYNWLRRFYDYHVMPANKDIYYWERRSTIAHKKGFDERQRQTGRMLDSLGRSIAEYNHRKRDVEIAYAVRELEMSRHEAEKIYDYASTKHEWENHQRRRLLQNGDVSPYMDKVADIIAANQETTVTFRFFGPCPPDKFSSDQVLGTWEKLRVEANYTRFIGRGDAEELNQQYRRFTELSIKIFNYLYALEGLQNRSPNKRVSVVFEAYENEIAPSPPQDVTALVPTGPRTPPTETRLAYSKLDLWLSDDDAITQMEKLMTEHLFWGKGRMGQSSENPCLITCF